MTFAHTVGSVQGRPLTLNTAGPGVQMQTVTLLLNSGGGGGSGSEGEAGWEGETIVPTAIASPLICTGRGRLAMVVIVCLDNKHLFNVTKEGRVCFFYFFYLLNQFLSVLHTSPRPHIWYFKETSWLLNSRVYQKLFWSVISQAVPKLVSGLWGQRRDFYQNTTAHTQAFSFYHL